GVCIAATGHEVSQLAAQAVAHRTDPAAGAFVLAQGGKRGTKIFNSLVHVKKTKELEGALPLGFRFIGKLDAGFDPPENVWAAGDIALAGEPVAGIAHHLIDAEDLLDNQDRRSRCAGG